MLNPKLCCSIIYLLFNCCVCVGSIKLKVHIKETHY